MTEQEVSALMVELRDSPTYSPSRVLAVNRELAGRGGLRYVARWALRTRPACVSSFAADLRSAVIPVMLDEAPMRMPYTAPMLAGSQTAPVFRPGGSRCEFASFEMSVEGLPSNRMRVSCEYFTELAQIIVIMLHVDNCYMKPFDGVSIPSDIAPFRLQASILLPPPPAVIAEPGTTNTAVSTGGYTREPDVIEPLTTSMSLAEIARVAPPCMRRDLAHVVDGIVPHKQLGRLRVAAIWKHTGLPAAMLTGSIKAAANSGRDNVVRDFAVALRSESPPKYSCRAMVRAQLCPFAAIGGAQHTDDIERLPIGAVTKCATMCGVEAPPHASNWAPSVAIRGAIERHELERVMVEYDYVGAGSDSP